jgi:hypothetical protein
MGAAGKVFLASLTTGTVQVVNSALTLKTLYPTDFSGLLPDPSDVGVGTVYNLGTTTGTLGVALTAGDLRAALFHADDVNNKLRVSTEGAVELDSDTIQEIADAVGSSGTGARTVTITVNDGTTVLQNATIRLTEGANTFTASTNVSGVAVFNLDDATYAVAITKSGYSYAGTTLVVDGTETRTYSMTAISITPPDDPALCAVVFHLRDQFGADKAGEPVEITFVKWEETAAQTPPVVSVPPVQTTDSGGLVEVELYRDATYRIVYGSAGYARRVDVVVPDANGYTVEI